MKPNILLFLGSALLWAGCSGSSDRDYAERMGDEHRHDSPAPSGMVRDTAVPVDTMRVQYATVNGRALYGYMAVPEGQAEADLPALIVIQEWWGLNENIKSMTRQLAAQGYRALAVDMYKGEVAATSEEAMRLMRAATENPAELVENLEDAYAYLTDEHDAPRVGSIGWCFGGGLSLQAAIALPGLDAAVIYYGRLETDRARLSQIQAPVLGFFGAKDEGIPVAGVHDFHHTLEELDKDVEVHIYDDADHAFANPSGGNYNETAAQDAWRRTLAFLDEHLRPGRN